MLWPRATSSACCCRRARSSSTARCRRRGRSSTRARRSRSRPTSTPAAPSARACRVVCSLACTQLQSHAGARRSAACTVNAAHVARPRRRIGRLAPGYAADLVLLDAPDWRYLAYHLGGDLVATVIEGGEVAWSRAAERSERIGRARLALCLHASSAAAGRRNGGTSTSTSTSTTRGRKSSRLRRTDPSGTGRATGATRTAARRRGKAGRPLRQASRPPGTGRFAARSSFLPLFFIVFSLVNKSSAIEARFLSSLAYSALFVPFSYLMDRTAYRTYLRRSGQRAGAEALAAARPGLRGASPR